MTALSDAIIAWFEANAPDDIKDELISDIQVDTDENTGQRVVTVISDSTKTSEDSGD